MSWREKVRREPARETHYTPSYAEEVVKWHEDLTRVGIEEAPDFTFFGCTKFPTGKIQRMLRHEKMPLGFCPEIPSTLWQNPEFRDIRNRLVRVHDTADALFRSIPHHQPLHTLVGERDYYKRENPNIHASRASYFALRYLGVTDPVIHALILFGSIQNNEFDAGRGENAMRYVMRNREVCGMITSGELPNNFIDLLSTLYEDDKRCNTATAMVERDERIPEHSRLGSIYTPESFWELYQDVTQLHTSDDSNPTDAFRGPTTLYPNSRYQDGGVTLGKYRQFVAQIALTHERFIHREKDLSALEMQKRALPILMELWPVSRGLDEGIFSRYVGECIAMAFLPREYKALGDTVKDIFPGDSLKHEKETYAHWYRDLLTTLLPGATFVSTHDQIRNEYRELRRQDVQYKPSDVAVPGTTGSGEISGVNNIDTKTRLSVFWKMLEIWNDRREGGKYHKLPDHVKRMTWGSPEFWEWTITHQHDIFRTQLLLLGNHYNQTSREAIAQLVKEMVRDSGNQAVCMFPEFAEEEILQTKEIGQGLWFNAILRFLDCRTNLELQLCDGAAYRAKAIEAGPWHHAAYKLRHLIDWSQQKEITATDRDHIRLNIAIGARKLRTAHLAATYGFEEDTVCSAGVSSQKGTIFRR